MAETGREGEGAEILRAAARLLEAARGGGLRIACAESCTGGGVGAAITAIPGASEAFLGAVVTYSNGAKSGILSVSPEDLERFGAVSEPVALAMARGARRLFGADLAVSVTGVAGPEGGSPQKPVGTVWFGLDGPDGERAVRECFEGSRDRIRSAAVLRALALLEEACGRGRSGTGKGVEALGAS